MTRNELTGSLANLWPISPPRVQSPTGFGEVAGARVWSAGVDSLAGTHKVKWFL